MPRTFPLLGYLLINRDATLVRKEVAFEIWPDSKAGDARANFRRHLSELNQKLHAATGYAPWIVSEGTTIRWNGNAPYWLDVEAFEQCVNDPARSSAALELYVGDLLMHLDAEWIYPERSRLRAIYCTALEQALDIAFHAADFSRAARIAQRLLTVEPHREDVLRTLMIARYEQGNRVGALAAYCEFAKLMATELDTELDDETRAVFDLMKQRSRLRPGPTLAPRSILPFVGRYNELVALDCAWVAATAGGSSLAIISGEPGVGKTRLASELALRLEATGVRALFGGEAEGPSQPYRCVVEALRSALPSLMTLDLGDTWNDALASLIPELVLRSPRAATATRLEPEREQQVLFDAVAEAFAHLSARRPLFVVLEDIQWSADATVAMIEQVVRRAASERLQILVTYRSDASDTRSILRELIGLERDGSAVHVPLGRLDRSALGDLVDVLAPETPDRDEYITRLLALSDGSPLLLYEALSRAREWKQLVPNTSTDLIERWLEKLSPPARALAQVAAVLGNGFEMRDVEAMGGWNSRAAVSLLDELLDHHIVQRGTPHSHLEYRFTHQLLQARLYDDLSPVERRRLHHRATTVIRRKPEVELDVGALAAHLEGAGRWKEAALAYERAAARALRLFVNDDANRLAMRGMSLAPDRSYGLLEIAEEAQNRLGNRERQAAILDEMDRLAATNEQHWSIARRRTTLAHAIGDRIAEKAALNRLAKLVAVESDTRMASDLVFLRARMHLAGGEPAVSISMLREAVGSDMWCGDREGGIQARCLLAEALGVVGAVPEACLLLAAVATDAEMLDDVILLRVLGASCALLYHAGDYNELAATAGRMLQIALHVGDRERAADARNHLGVAHGRLRHFDRAIEAYAEALATYRSLGRKRGEAAVLLNSGYLAYVLGDAAELFTASEQAAAIFDTLGDLRGGSIARFNMSNTSLLMEQPAAAETYGRAALELAQRFGSPALETNALAAIAQALLAVGRIDDALDYFDRSLNIERGMANPHEIADDLADYAVALSAAGRCREALSTLRELDAIPNAERVSYGYPQRIFWAQALVHHRAGRHDDAARFLTRAYAVYEEQLALLGPRGVSTYPGIAYNSVMLTTLRTGRWPGSEQWF